MKCILFHSPTNWAKLVIKLPVPKLCRGLVPDHESYFTKFGISNIVHDFKCELNNYNHVTRHLYG